MTMTPEEHRTAWIKAEYETLGWDKGNTFIIGEIALEVGTEWTAKNLINVVKIINITRAKAQKGLRDAELRPKSKKTLVHIPEGGGLIRSDQKARPFTQGKPDREKIAKIIRYSLDNLILITDEDWEDLLKGADQIIALFDETEIRKQIIDKTIQFLEDGGYGDKSKGLNWMQFQDKYNIHRG